MDNGDIAWCSGSDIYYWDGTSTTRLTDNTVDDNNPVLFNGEIVWYGTEDGDNEIYYARLASAWIQDDLPMIDIMDFTESEILELADLYSSKSSGVVGGMDWTYLDGDLPSDTNGEVYEIGDSWIYEGNYYIKLGSGLAGTSGAVPEVPASTVLMLLSSLFISRREKSKEGNRIQNLG